MELLNRGLTFIPTIDTEKDLKTQLKLDIQNYHRRLKLAAYFGKKKNDKREIPRFTPASLWTPPPDKLPPEINFLVKKDYKDFNRYFKPYREKANLSEEEKEALEDLVTKKRLIIKPADKGSAIVILGREQYLMEVNRQLNDTQYYKKLREPIYLKTVPVIDTILTNLYRQKFINAKQRKYLKGEFEPRARRFYILPKIHKEPEKWTVPFKVPPGRPIVSDCGSETYQTAEYIDYFLNPLSTKHSSYIKDTYHFISIIKSLKIPSNAFFFTIDIDSLYTNIDTVSGLRAVKDLFQKYPNTKRPDREILQLLEINLTKNDFEFNNEYFLQIKGTAMGKKFAPAYANIFMADWEEKALRKCKKRPLQYYRYLDDIFGIWSDSTEEFMEFIKTLDTHDPSIRLKYTFNEHSIDFLDTTVYKGKTFHENQTLDIKVFFKKTDTHALLFKTSFHPRHTYKGLIKSQLLRFNRICTQEEDFKQAVKILFDTLRTRGYSRPFLRTCFKTFQINKSKDQKKVIPLITNFSSVSTRLNKIFKNNYTTIVQNQGLLEDYQVISAYRRNKNLRDYLVTAKVQSLQQFRKPHILSKHFLTLKYVFNNLSRTIFKLHQRFKPQTSNCVYLIFCANCGKQYIGETKNSISTRMAQHRYNIKNKKETHTPLVKHFIAHGLHSFRVAGIQSNSGWTDKERKTVERKWIYLLETKVPFGLNVKNN